MTPRQGNNILFRSSHELRPRASCVPELHGYKDTVRVTGMPRWVRRSQDTVDRTLIQLMQTVIVRW